MNSCFETVLIPKDQIDKAVEVLRSGDIVAFPTETVYGLGAPIFDEEAVKKIFLAKGRPSDNPLIAHVSNLDQVLAITKDLPDDFFILFEEFFPGPLAVVLPKSDVVPSVASGGLDSIAIRMPSDPIALQLIDKLGQPIVAPSANLSGRPSSTCSAHVFDDFKGKIAAVIDAAPSEIGIESTVVSLLDIDPIILRPGQITKEQIESALQKEVKVHTYDPETNGLVLSPGVKYRHYAPKAPVYIFYSAKDLIDHLQQLAGSFLFIMSPVTLPCIDRAIVYPLSEKELYAGLRASDAYDVDEVLIFCDDNIRQNLGLMNRIQRAAHDG
jgi:L-threonylcarbamoyladenylate synthase